MNAAANSAARARYLERLQRPLALIEQAIAAGREPPPLFHHYLDDPEQVAIEALRSDVYVPVTDRASSQPGT